MREIREIKFAPGYGVDSEGNVYSRLSRGPRGSRIMPHWRMKAPSVSTKGYLNVQLMIDGKRIGIGVHRLVVTAFMGEIPEGLEVNHRDGIKTNNALSNLEVVTPRENIAHSRSTGLSRCHHENHHQAKLTPEQVEEIRAAFNAEKQRDIAARFGISQSSVWRIGHGRTWK